jgi:ribonuclease D
VGGVHVFDQPRMTIIQVYSGKHIFIFDYTDLKENDRFKEIIVYLFTYCKIYGHDHVKELTVMQRELQLDIKEEVMQQLMRNRVTDTNKLYKTFNPKDNKSNLVHICEMLIGKPISKFEQCSGWA